MEIKVLESVKDIPCEVLVINKFEDEKTSQELANTYAVDKDNFEGKFGQTYLLHTLGKIPADKILVVGFGKKEEFNADKMRLAVSKAVKKLQQIHAKNACFDFDVMCDYGKSAAIGAMIADYAFDKYKTEKAVRVDEITFAKFSEKDVKEGIIFGEAMKFARDLANEPADFATPSKLAEIASNLDGITAKIYDKDEIERMGMGAYLAVGKGSAQPPKFIHMKYSGKNPKKKIALIGKGICFDSGGLDIKPAASMLTMRDDMSGAACVLGVMRALSALEPDVEVHGIIAACENMPSGTSYKPGDILRAKNGKTIEVDNTDAEGRLTLADALCYACELGVDEVIDIATLTGACVVALGTTVAGIMGNDEDMISTIIRTAADCGETFWELPLFADYKDSLKSDIADMKNTGSRMGGASIAGVFLKEFVDGPKWAHIDIAGTAFLEKPQKEFIAGATGAGVRTLLNYVKNS
ncbi:TPA: leucyl aminopeptidase, partial [Candidatus Scatousia excrementigallinarum]|nr:leucyl aminopeptidase [Candidatus Scatousia excrementigallinarum]